tara:strand:- start:179 stop:1057 length:879 start_codon:yes stop_codon:yes gene_type:complete
MFWLVWTSIASANAGLEWRWSPGESVAYHVESVVETPRGRRWYAEENDVARATKQMMLMDIRCSGVPAGKRTAVTCTMDTVEFRGVAVAGEEDTLAAIMSRDATRLQGRKLFIEMRADGRFSSIDLEPGPPLKTSRAARIQDGLLQMIQRALAPLDLQLPKDGVDKGKKWKRKGVPLSMTLMTNQGTSGSVALKHSVTRWDGPTARVESTGRGTVAEGATIEQGTSTMLHVTGSGRAQFNTALGVIDWSESSNEIQYAAANLEGITGKERSRFSGWVARIGPDGERIEPTAD